MSKHITDISVASDSLIHPWHHAVCLSVCLHTFLQLHYSSHTPLRCPLAPPPQPALYKGQFGSFFFYAFSKTVCWWSILRSVLWSHSLDSNASNDGLNIQVLVQRRPGRIQTLHHQICSQTAGGTSQGNVITKECHRGTWFENMNEVSVGVIKCQRAAVGCKHTADWSSLMKSVRI